MTVAKRSAGIVVLLGLIAALFPSMVVGAEALHVGDPGVTPPRVIKQGESKAPELCKHGHTWQGYLFLYQVRVDELGNATLIKPLKVPTITPPCPELFEAHRETIQHTKYRPALFKGKPVPVVIAVSVQYEVGR